MPEAAPHVVLTPTAFYQDPMAALRWLERAFGFETSLLVTDDAGRVGHAEMTYAGAVIGVGGEWASRELLGPASMKSPKSLDGAASQFIWVNVTGDVDEHCARARAAGAAIVQEPADQFYGARSYRALDLEGHVWNFRMTIAAISNADMAKASGLKIATALED